MSCLSPSLPVSSGERKRGSLECLNSAVRVENICWVCGLERVPEEALNHPQAGRAACGPLWPEDRAVGGPWGAHCPNARLGHRDHCMEPETQSQS